MPLTFTAQIIAVDDSGSTGTGTIVSLVDSVEYSMEFQDTTSKFLLVALPISMAPKFALKAARHNKARHTQLAATATSFVEKDFIPVSHMRDQPTPVWVITKAPLQFACCDDAMKRRLLQRARVLVTRDATGRARMSQYVLTQVRNTTAMCKAQIKIDCSTLCHAGARRNRRGSHTAATDRRHGDRRHMHCHAAACVERRFCMSWQYVMATIIAAPISSPTNAPE